MIVLGYTIVQIPEIMMYVYDNLKRKWKERQQTELLESNIITSVAIGNDSERIIPREMLPIAVPEPATPDIMFRNLHDTEILKSLLLVSIGYTKTNHRPVS